MLGYALLRFSRVFFILDMDMRKERTMESVRIKVKVCKRVKNEGRVKN